MSFEIQYQDKFGIVLAKMMLSESSTLSEMMAGCPQFFKDKLGENEKYTIYRGQIIVECDLRLSDNILRHKFVVYIFDAEKKEMFCASSGDVSDMEESQRLIDAILKHKKLYYGMDQDLDKLQEV